MLHTHDDDDDDDDTRTLISSNKSDQLLQMCLAKENWNVCVCISLT